MFLVTNLKNRWIKKKLKIKKEENLKTKTKKMFFFLIHIEKKSEEVYFSKEAK